MQLQTLDNRLLCITKLHLPYLTQAMKRTIAIVSNITVQLSISFVLNSPE